MSLVNQVPKIVPEDFETMLNSNINVSAIPGLLGACAFLHLSRTPVEGVGEGDLEGIEETGLRLLPPCSPGSGEESTGARRFPSCCFLASCGSGVSVEMRKCSQAFPSCLPPSTLAQPLPALVYPGLPTPSVHHTPGQDQPFCSLFTQPLTHPGFLLFQDLLMVTYLANLTQSQIALNEKLVNL